MKKLLLLIVAILAGMLTSNAEIYVVTANRLTVRTKPSASAKSMGQLEKGLEIDVIETSGGFAKLEFFGKTGYVNARYLKKKSAGNEDEATASKPAAKAKKETRKAAAPRAKEQAIVYVFYDVKHYIKDLPISVNGKVVTYMQGSPTTGKMTGTRYEKSMRKLIVHGEGKMVIANDFTWADKPYHRELSLNVSDGGVYYVKIYIENMFNAFMKKRTGLEMKQLSQKDGLKELQKEGHYEQNPDVEIDL